MPGIEAEMPAVTLFGRTFESISTGGGFTALSTANGGILITDADDSTYTGGPEWLIGFYDREGQQLAYISSGGRLEYMQIPGEWKDAELAAQALMDDLPELESRSALKQAALSRGVAAGDELAIFVGWAESRA